MEEWEERLRIANEDFGKMVEEYPKIDIKVKCFADPDDAEGRVFPLLTKEGKFVLFDGEDDMIIEKTIVDKEEQLVKYFIEYNKDTREETVIIYIYNKETGKFEIKNAKPAGGKEKQEDQENEENNEEEQEQDQENEENNKDKQDEQENEEEKEKEPEKKEEEEEKDVAESVDIPQEEQTEQEQTTEPDQEHELIVGAAFVRNTREEDLTKPAPKSDPEPKQTIQPEIGQRLIIRHKETMKTIKPLTQGISKKLYDAFKKYIKIHNGEYDPRKIDDFQILSIYYATLNLGYDDETNYKHDIQEFINEGAVTDFLHKFFEKILNRKIIFGLTKKEEMPQVIQTQMSIDNKNQEQITNVGVAFVRNTSGQDPLRPSSEESPKQETKGLISKQLTPEEKESKEYKAIEKIELPKSNGEKEQISKAEAKYVFYSIIQELEDTKTDINKQETEQITKQEFSAFVETGEVTPNLQKFVIQKIEEKERKEFEKIKEIEIITPKGKQQLTDLETGKLLGAIKSELSKNKNDEKLENKDNNEKQKMTENDYNQFIEEGQISVPLKQFIEAKIGQEVVVPKPNQEQQKIELTSEEVQEVREELLQNTNKWIDEENIKKEPPAVQLKNAIVGISVLKQSEEKVPITRAIESYFVYKELKIPVPKEESILIDDPESKEAAKTYKKDQQFYDNIIVMDTECLAVGVARCATRCIHG